MNPVLGCGHGCKYPCYAWLMAVRFGKVKSFEQWTQPAIVSNALPVIESELKKWSWKIHRVQLCLTTDPFMVGFPEVQELSFEAIRMINAAGIPCSVLTKGILPAKLADLDPRNEYRISLVSLDEDFRSAWEPGASSYEERIAALRELHERGAQTGVHIEPYPTPNIYVQDLHDILEVVKFVDSIDLMPWNYSRLPKQFPDAEGFYQAMQDDLQEFCQENAIHYGNPTQLN